MIIAIITTIAIIMKISIMMILLIILLIFSTVLHRHWWPCCWYYVFLSSFLWIKFENLFLPFIFKWYLNKYYSFCYIFAFYRILHFNFKYYPTNLINSSYLDGTYAHWASTFTEFSNVEIRFIISEVITFPSIQIVIWLEYH